MASHKEVCLVRCYFIYLNDIINIHQDEKFIIYADDVSVFFSGGDVHGLIQACNTLMAALEKWSKSNYMRVNEKKTKALIFHPKNKPVPSHDPIMFSCRQIEVVDQFKCLGVVFSSTMSWENHVNHVVSRLGRITGTVGCIRYILPKSLKLLLDNSLFYSHMNYCQLVWGTATHSLLKKIHLLQKKFLRYVFNVKYCAPSKCLFLEAGVITIYDLYKYRLSVRFKIETKRNIDHIRNLAHLQQKKTSYPFRMQGSWFVPMVRLNTGWECLKYALPSLLNMYDCEGFDLFRCTHRELRCRYI